jgi:hypothetical protein
VALWLRELSVRARPFLDPTYVHESVGKIQVVQIRRVLLLFALVLGLSALVASLAPPPEDSGEGASETPATTVEEAVPVPAAGPRQVTLAARAHPPTRRIEAGSSLSLTVSVPAPGDVVLEDLGLRQSADPLTPARFALLAEPPGRHAVTFVPVDGERRVLGRLAFVEPATVTQPRRGR